MERRATKKARALHSIAKPLISRSVGLISRVFAGRYWGLLGGEEIEKLSTETQENDEISVILIASNRLKRYYIRATLRKRGKKPMEEQAMNTPMLRIVCLPTVQLPTQSFPAQIGTSYPNGVPVAAPRPMEHPLFITRTVGYEITFSEPANDSTLVIANRP